MGEFLGFVFAALLVMILVGMGLVVLLAIVSVLLAPLSLLPPVVTWFVGVLHRRECKRRGLDPERDLEFHRAKMEADQWTQRAQAYKANGDDGRAAECERMAANAAVRAAAIEASQGSK